MPRPALTNRGRVLAMLRSAGDAGVSVRDLKAAGIPCPAIHIESLTCETGLAIESDGRLVPAADGGCRSSEQFYFLTRDEWAPAGTPKLLDRLRVRGREEAAA